MGKSWAKRNELRPSPPPNHRHMFPLALRLRLDQTIARRESLEDGLKHSLTSLLEMAMGMFHPLATILLACSTAALPAPMTLSWEKNILTIRGEQLPGGVIEALYIEAYCREDAHQADWRTHTVIGHRTELVSRSDDRTQLKLRCLLSDGVTVEHTIRSAADEVDFELVLHNPTSKPSAAQWGQPCVRVGQFTGLGDPQNPQTYRYLEKSFVFIDGQLETMPTRDWATEARYVPGQVWRAPDVPAKDVNPRPLNPHIPSNGLIGCFSGDERQLLAIAFEPWHELFQGVITCLHSDFHIGGLAPGQSKTLRGKIYVLPNDVPGLLARYRRDFPAAAASPR